MMMKSSFVAFFVPESLSNKATKASDLLKGGVFVAFFAFELR